MQLRISLAAKGTGLCDGVPLPCVQGLGAAARFHQRARRYRGSRQGRRRYPPQHLGVEQAGGHRNAGGDRVGDNVAHALQVAGKARRQEVIGTQAREHVRAKLGRGQPDADQRYRPDSVTMRLTTDVLVLVDGKQRRGGGAGRRDGRCCKGSAIAFPTTIAIPNAKQCRPRVFMSSPSRVRTWG